MIAKHFVPTSGIKSFVIMGNDAETVSGGAPVAGEKTAS